jgi:hypothetical protein
MTLLPPHLGGVRPLFCFAQRERQRLVADASGVWDHLRQTLPPEILALIKLQLLQWGGTLELGGGGSFAQ